MNMVETLIDYNTFIQSARAPDRPETVAIRETPRHFVAPDELDQCQVKRDGLDVHSSLSSSVNDTSSRQPIDCPAPTLGHWPNFPPSTTI
jgi:hypothetical protein